MKSDQERSKKIYNLCMNLVTGVFALCGMALIAVGVLEYKNIAMSARDTYTCRTSLSYVATKVRQCDSEGSVTIKEVSGTPMLLLYEEEDGAEYETAVYWYDGALREYYHDKDEAFSLQNGFEVVPVEGFDIKMAEPGLLYLKAYDSDGMSDSMYICIHSMSR